MKSSRRSRTLCIALTGALAAALLPVTALADSTSFYTGDGVAVEIITSAEGSAEYMAENWEEGTYFSEAEIDADTGEVLADETETTLSEQFDISVKTEAGLIDGEPEENAEDIAEYLEDQEIYEIEENGDTVTVTSPYQLKRIILTCSENKLKNTYGAVSAAYQTEDGQYLLLYETEEDTKYAYEKLQAMYGDNAALDGVIFAESLSGTEAASLTSSSLTASSVSWGIKSMGLDSLRDEAEEDTSLSGRSVTVAVLDSGANSSHELLKGRISSGKDFITSSSSYADKYDHGTFVAGVIAEGTSSHVSLMILKVLDNSGYGSYYVMGQAVKYATAQGASVINISAAGDNVKKNSKDYNYLEPYLKAAKQANVTVCVASGNGNAYQGNAAYDLADSNTYPAYSSNVITVGSVDSSKTWSYFSNYGDALDFVAPGEQVLGASCTGNNIYKYDSGTSMASPHIAAAAAMIYLYHPSYTAAKVKKVLRQHSSKGINNKRNKKYGYGFVTMSSSSATALKKTQSIKGLTSSSTIRLTYGSGKKSLGKAVSSIGAKITYTSSKTSVAKVGSAGKVTPKSIGTTTITVTAAGNSTYDCATKTYTIKVIPKKTAIKKIKAGKKSMTITWKKKKPSTGYQIRYSTKKSMKNAKKKKVKGTNKTSVTIKGLKAKTYYVQVRVYKTKNGKTYYGKWSSKKKVKVKK